MALVAANERVLMGRPSSIVGRCLRSLLYSLLVGRALGFSARAAPASIDPGSGWGRAATEDELRVVPPKLYVYEHCPFCVRARMILGLAGVEHDLAFLQNDDARTPTRLIGKKVLPILEDAAAGVAIGESLDIVARLDAAGLLAPATGREDLQRWMERVADVRSKLTRPRIAISPLAEFATARARGTWVANHQFTDGTRFDDALDDAALVPAMNRFLEELDALVESEEHISPGGVSYDDILYFPHLRTLSLVRGLEFPPRTRAYMERMSEKADVPLLWQMAV